MISKEELKNNLEKIIQKDWQMLLGEKPLYEGQERYYFSHMNKMHRHGALTDEPRKYVRYHENDDKSMYDTAYFGKSHFSNQSMINFYGAQKEAGITERHGIINTKKLLAKEKIDYNKGSAIYINAGGHRSTILLREALLARLKGEFNGPIVLHNPKKQGERYFNEVFRSVGIETRSQQRELFEEIGIHEFGKATSAGKWMANQILSNKIEKKEGIPYRRDPFKSFDSSKSLVLLTVTENEDKVTWTKRMAKKTGVSTEVYMLSDLAGIVPEAKELEGTFVGNNIDKLNQARKALKKADKNGSFDDKCEKYYTDRNQCAVIAHDGGSDYHPEFKELVKGPMPTEIESLEESHQAKKSFKKFKRVIKLLEERGKDFDAVESKARVELFSGTRNEYQAVAALAEFYGREDFLEITSYDNYAMFYVSDPSKVYHYSDNETYKISPEKLKELDDTHSKFDYYAVPKGYHKKTKAELGVLEKSMESTEEQDNFLLTNTAQGRAFATMVHDHRLTMLRTTGQEVKADISRIQLFAASKHVGNLLYDKNFIKTLEKNPNIVLSKDRMQVPADLNSYDREMIETADIFIEVPLPDYDQKPKDREETIQRIDEWKNAILHTSKFFVGNKDLRKDNLVGKILIKYDPGIDGYSFKNVDRPFISNTKKFKKPSIKDFTKNADSANKISSISDKHRQEYVSLKTKPLNDYERPEIKKTNCPMVSVYGISKTDNEVMLRDMEDFIKKSFEKGIGISYGGMQEGLGEALNRVLEDEIFMAKIGKKIESGEIPRLAVARVYTKESREKEGLKNKESFPEITKKWVDIYDYEARDINERVDQMRAFSDLNDFGGKQITVITPGSNGTLEEFAMEIHEIMNDPSREIILMNSKYENEGFLDEWIGSLADHVKVSTDELEEFGIYVCNDAKEVHEKIDSLTGYNREEEKTISHGK